MDKSEILGVRSTTPTFVLTGVFLLSMSGLILEISITRIFSAAIWYHYAFLAVSLALLGWGAAGLVLHFGKRDADRNWSGRVAVIASIVIAVSIPLILLVMHLLSSQVQYLPLFLILSTIPFFFVGLVIALAFRTFANIASTVYFADLTGASLGCLIVVALLYFIGGENTALTVGIIATVAAMIFAYESKSKVMLAISAVFLVLSSVILAFNHSYQIFSIPTDPTSRKDLPIFLREHPGTRVVKTAWNSYSKIDVVEGSNPSMLEEGLAAKLFIDGGAGMNVLLWDGDISSRDELTRWMQYLPFRLFNSPKVLVIGSGGGRDILAALVSGSKDVTAVEINPLIFNIVNEYGPKAGNIYQHPGVNANVDEGRSFVTRSNEKYDVIYIPFVDTWAAVSSGGLSLAENYLYTIEGFQEYYDHLTEKGTIVVVRWLRDSPRLVATFTQLLENNGIPATEAHRHLVAVTDQSLTEDPSITVVMFSILPFTNSQLDFLASSFAMHGYQPILLPGYIMLDPYDKLFRGDITLEEFYEFFEHRVHPVTDDSPYFLTIEKPLPEILINLLKICFAIVVLFVGAPIFWASVRKKNKSTGALHVLPYFAALGIGFMLIEVALLQKLILLLGNPTTTLAILLFTLLLFGGVGSWTSKRIIQDKNEWKIAFLIGGIIVLAFLYAVFMTNILSELLPMPFLVRASVSVAMLALLGFMLGMPFPAGIRVTEKYFRASVSWMWAINGAFSVLGSVLATTIGIMYGLSWSMWLGVLVYGIALGIAINWKKTIYTFSDVPPA